MERKENKNILGTFCSIGEKYEGNDRKDEMRHRAGILLHRVVYGSFMASYSFNLRDCIREIHSACVRAVLFNTARNVFGR